jgi:hypothetical protein
MRRAACAESAAAGWSAGLTVISTTFWRSLGRLLVGANRPRDLLVERLRLGAGVGGGVVRKGG